MEQVLAGKRKEKGRRATPEGRGYEIITGKARRREVGQSDGVQMCTDTQGAPAAT